MEFYATEKIDGTSMTTFVENGELNICSRKLCLAKNPGNTFWQVAEKLKVAPATLSFHFKALSHAGLIDSRQEGRFIYYAANFAVMNGMVAYLTENCCGGDAAVCQSKTN